MVKKIKFPLEMANGVQVRSLEELQENFDLEKIIDYYMSGKLLVWLKDRYYDNEAEQILKLHKNDKNIKQKICDIFGVKYTGLSNDNIAKFIDIDKLEECFKKISKLKNCTDDEETSQKETTKNNTAKDEKKEDKPITAQYKPSALLDSLMKSSDRDASSKMFYIINDKLLEFNYDMNKKTKNNNYIIKHANLREMFDNYLDRIS